MDLREYLFRKRLTVKEFSETLDYTRTHLSQIINGNRRPSKRLAKAIEELTEGEVTIHELLKKKNKKKDL